VAPALAAARDEVDDGLRPHAAAPERQQRCGTGTIQGREGIEQGGVVTWFGTFRPHSYVLT